MITNETGFFFFVDLSPCNENVNCCDNLSMQFNYTFYDLTETKPRFQLFYR